MTKIITIGSQKGGVGKSTLCLNLAYALQTQLRVGLIDSDLQGSLQGLYAIIEGIKLLPNNIDLRTIKEATNLDIILIDTPPYLTNKLLDFFIISDLVIIPTKASVLDVMSIKDTMNLIKKAESLKEGTINTSIVLNMIKISSSINKEIQSMIEDFQNDIFQSQISDRVAFVRSPLTAGVLKSNDQKAKNEIMQLAIEVIDKLK